MKLSTDLPLLSILAAGALALPAAAQDRESRQRLQDAVRVDCSFIRIATSDWTDAGPEIATDSTEFTAVFFDIDVESATAEAEGQFGASYIIVRYAEGYLHFMQTLSSGPLYLTTVLAEPSAEGRLKAVHTRHEYTEVSLPGFTSRPELYVGDCAVETAAD